MLALLNNFDVTKVTLHYILPSLCDRGPPAKTKSAFDAVMEKTTVIDSISVFQEAISRVRQKNSVTILFNMEILIKLVNDQRLTVTEVESYSCEIRELLKTVAKLADHSDSKIRKVAMDCLQSIFEVVEDDFETLRQHYFSNVRDFIEKELRTACQKVKKKGDLIRLFDRETASSRVQPTPGEAHKPGDAWGGGSKLL